MTLALAFALVVALQAPPPPLVAPAPPVVEPPVVIEPAPPAVVAPAPPVAPEDPRGTAALVASIGGGAGATFGWVMGAVLFTVIVGSESEIAQVVGLTMPVLFGGAGALVGALIAMPPSSTATTTAMIGATVGALAGGTIAISAGAFAWQLQPQGNAFVPSGDQIIVGFITLVATPVVVAAGGGLGAYVGAGFE